MATADDRQLLAQIRAGDAGAFEAVVARHHGRLVRLARLFVSSEASAEEVVQDTWVAVLDGLDGFEERSSLVTWISRILVNRAKTKGTREARTVPFSSLGNEDDDAPGEPAVDPNRFDDRGMWSAPPDRWDADSPERLAGNAELLVLLDAELRQLPDRQRIVVVLRDMLGWNADEVCNALEINETNQRVLLHRARARLRTRLETHVKNL